MPTRYKHIVIVHGIGDQAPNETSINFMNHFFRALPSGPEYSLKVHNLISSVDPPDAKNPKFRPAFAEFKHRDGECVIGFSEVYWQDVTNEILKKFHKCTPIPIFIWAHAINTHFMGKDFYAARDVITNLESLLSIADNLSLILKRAGIFLKVLTRFVGDVQMYAESTDIRNAVDAHFASVLGRVDQQHRDAAIELGTDLDTPEIYIVAHSEGTVVAYSSLVKAAALQPPVPWLPWVKALVTLGSPIDKHFGIWPARFRVRTAGVTTLNPRIPWFNFWDVSDPVGYGMRSLKSRPEEPPSDAEQLFDLRFDSGFARYAIPGAAHVGYWNDTAIHEQIIDQAMGLGTTRKSTDVTTRIPRVLQPVGDWVSYFIGRTVTVAALVFFLANLAAELPDVPAWLNFLKPPPDSPQWLFYAMYLLGPLVICKLLWEVYKEWGRFWLWLRGVVFLVWLGLLAASALALRPSGADHEIKDVMGYGLGLVVTILVWQLHTRVHKGLVQMWRYTTGVETSAAAGWRDPTKERARGAAA